MSDEGRLTPAGILTEFIRLRKDFGHNSSTEYLEAAIKLFTMQCEMDRHAQSLVLTPKTDIVYKGLGDDIKLCDSQKEKIVKIVQANKAELDNV